MLEWIVSTKAEFSRACLTQGLRAKEKEPRGDREALTSAQIIKSILRVSS